MFRDFIAVGVFFKGSTQNEELNEMSGLAGQT